MLNVSPLDTFDLLSTISHHRAYCSSPVSMLAYAGGGGGSSCSLSRVLDAPDGPLILSCSMSALTGRSTRDFTAPPLGPLLLAIILCEALGAEAGRGETSDIGRTNGSAWVFCGIRGLDVSPSSSSMSCTDRRFRGLDLAL